MSGCRRRFGSRTPRRLFTVSPGDFAQSIAEAAGVAIDTGVYDKVRLFRRTEFPAPKNRPA